ncbi:MAG: hypothetical protein OEU49_05585 [Chromatiales bacterium]|nr:hypothetical protein [Chromatiales bacterium]
MTKTSGNDDSARRARTIRSAILLGLAALAVYGAFIFVQYQRSRGGM